MGAADKRDTGQSCPTGGPSGGVGSGETTARTGYGRIGGERGCAVPVQDSQKRRKAELSRVEAADRAMEVTRVPEPVASTATRVKRQRVHKPALEAKEGSEGGMERLLMIWAMTKAVRPLRDRSPIPPRRWKNRIILGR